MKKLFVFSAVFFFIVCANCLLAQENPSSLEIEKLTRQKEYLRTRIYEIVRENKILEEKIKLFEGKANTYDEVVAKDQKIINELKVAYDQLEHDMKTLQEENNSLLNSLEDKESFIQNIQENVEKEILIEKKQFSAELERKNQDFNAVQNQLKESQGTLSKIQTQYNLARESSSSDQEEKESALEENKTLKEQILKSASQVTNTDLIADRDDRKEKMALLSRDKESFAAELVAQKDKYEVLEKKFDQLAASGNRLTEGLDTLKARNRDLEAQHAVLMTEKKSKEAAISELNKNKESLMQELASFSERYKTLEEKFSRISQSAIKNDKLIVKEVEKARKPLEELNSSLEKRVAELTAIVEKEGKNISELVEKKRDTEVVNRSLTNENKQISEKLVSLEAQLKSAQESFDAKLVEVKTPLDGKILYLEEKLKKMDANEALLGQASKKNDQLQAELQTLQNENKKLNNDLAAVNDLLHETDEFLAKKVEEAAIEKEAEIKQLRKKLGMTEGQGKAFDDVSLKK